MATYLRSKRPDGRVISCNATCHQARTPQCICPCGGRYHGVGREKAAEMFAEDVKAGFKFASVYKDEKGADVPIEIGPFEPAPTTQTAPAAVATGEKK
jgi:hypothetical protein